MYTKLPYHTVFASICSHEMSDTSKPIVAAAAGSRKLSTSDVLQEQDEKAIVSLQDRIIQGTQTHEEGFAEWLRQRDQQAMVSRHKPFIETTEVPILT